MNCRVWYKPDGRVAITYPAPKARRQLNIDEVTTARTAHNERLNAQKRAITARESATEAAEKYKEQAEATAVIAEAAVGPIVVIPDPIFEADQDFLDRVCLKASQGKELEGLPYDDVDPDTLPDRKDREKWRGSKGVGVQIDLSVITPADLRVADKAALEVERGKAVPNMKIALDLLLKLQENKY